MDATIIKNTMPVMATWSSARILFRVLLLLLGVASAALSVMWLPQFWSASLAKEITARLLADDRFKVSVLNDTLVRLNAGPEPVVARSDWARAEALIRLRIAAEAMESNAPEEIDRAATITADRLNASLAFNPADSFLWLMLYSFEVTRRGFDATTVSLLDQSFATGPLEGWIALRRNRLALAAFPALSDALQTMVVSEFAGLVDSDFTETAANNLIGIGWEQKGRLLDALEKVAIISREAFAKELGRRGSTAQVPGVWSVEKFLR